MESKKNNDRSNFQVIPLRISGGPGRYIQGAGALELLGETLREFGEAPLIVSDDTVWSILGGRVTERLESSGLKSLLASFGGECSRSEIERKLVTEAVELVVEANIYLSGLGVECGGLSAAHALTRGFSVIEEMHGVLHGEEVAFGLLIQLVLENRSREFLDDFIGFYRSIGLPCTFRELGLEKATEKHLQIIAERSCYEGSHIYKMTVPVDQQSLIDAIRFADALGLESGNPQARF